MWLEFPSVHAIAWIPFFKKFRPESYPEFEKFTAGNKSREQACSLLFLSGNDPAFDRCVLEDPAAFDRFLKSKNYRAALGLRMIILERRADGTLMVNATTVDKAKIVGYTPIRNILTRGKRVWVFSKGVGGTGTELEPDYLVFSDRVQITYTVLFRVGRLANIFAKILTGHYAPMAKMRVDYEVRADGTYTALVSGSAIPTQSWYFNGKHWNHDMLSISSEQTERFMEQDYPSLVAEGNYPPYQIS